MASATLTPDAPAPAPATPAAIDPLDHRGLVGSIARQHLGRGLDFEDLMQEGTIGLMTAARKFDPARGCAFSTYARYWVVQSITRAIERNPRPVAVPQYLCRLLAKSKADPGVVSKLKTGRGACLLEDRLREARLVLDARVVRDGDDPESGSLLADLEAPALPDEAEAIDLAGHRDRLLDAIADLPWRHANVIRMRFGIAPDRQLTLRGIATILGVSRERVRQIEQNALAILRRRLADPGEEDPCRRLTPRSCSPARSPSA